MPACGQLGDACLLNGDCCSDYCDEVGACAPACASLGSGCASDLDCCGALYCDVYGLCDDGTL
jgi:hypothetical protein